MLPSSMASRLTDNYETFRNHSKSERASKYLGDLAKVIPF